MRQAHRRAGPAPVRSAGAAKAKNRQKLGKLMVTGAKLSHQMGLHRTSGELRRNAGRLTLAGSE